MNSNWNYLEGEGEGGGEGGGDQEKDEERKSTVSRLVVFRNYGTGV